MRLEFLAKSMNGKELAHEVISVLSVTFGTGVQSHLAAMCDRSSVNNVAMRVVSIVHPSIIDISCTRGARGAIAPLSKQPHP